jgi:hypothetical protein
VTSTPGPMGLPVTRLSTDGSEALRSKRSGRRQSGRRETGGTPSSPGHGPRRSVDRPESRDEIGNPLGLEATREGPRKSIRPSDEKQRSSEPRRSPTGSAETTRGRTMLPRPTGWPGAWRVDGRTTNGWQCRGRDGRGDGRRDAAVGVDR